PGELCLGGAGVTRGYLHHPARTAEVFVPDPWEPGARLYRTGDRARLLPTGEIELLGRADGQVKIRGFRIEPGEIEAVLRLHPEVREAVVHPREALAREDRPGDLRLLAWVVPHGGAPDPRSLLAWLRERLPGFMIPGSITVLDALPLTASGKVDRAALPSPERASEGSSHPRTLMEEVLAGIWAGLLERDRVGRDESFFDLGGHSLLAVQVVSRVREAVGVELPLRVLFESPDVAATARVVEESLRTGSVLTAPPVVPLARTGPCACSFAQERLWVLDRLTPGSPAYNVPLALHFAGPLDAAALARALGEIVRRHEALRTSFPSVDGRPVQVIHPPAPVPLPAVDLSGLPAPEEEAGRLAVAESIRPFQLDRGPVLRSVLFRLAPGSHRLLVTFHHIVSDGWSLEIFLRELTEVYAACAGGRAPRLPALPVQYADFAVWQRGWLQGEALERQIRFWREALAGVPVNLELPLDHPRPPVLTVRGGRVPLVLPPPVVHGLRAVARESRATLFMVLASTFAILLSRLSGQDDVSMGTPSASRDRREIEGLIGFFANTLVLRTVFSGQPDVAALLAQVRERLLGAYAHQDLPFERLVEELNPERVLSHNTLVEAFFVLNQGGGASLETPGLAVSVVPVDNHTSRFDLLVSFNEEGSHLPGFLEYYADLFDAPTAARFARCFRVLAAALAGRAGGPVEALPLLDEAERAAVVVGWNDTAADYGAEEPFQALFEAQARRTPDAVAVTFGGTALSYRLLDAAAGRLAGFLQGLGVGPESLVGVAMERSLEVIVAFFGILKAGGAWVPLDPAYPRERLAYMLEDSGVEVLLTQERLAAILPETKARIVFLDGPPDAGAAAPRPVPVLPDGAAYMIYTSGSTGRPKGAVNTHRAIRNFLLWMQGRLGLRPDDRVLQTTPFSFDVSVWEVFWPVFNGARLVMAPPGAQQDPEEVLRLLEWEGITTVHFVPSMMEVFLDRSGLSACAGLRRVMSSGEALPWSLREAFFARMPAGIELHNLYGPTEAAVDVSSWECRRDDGQPIVPIGRPLANTRLYVLDRLLQPVPVGVQGELFAGGVQLARGYHRRPELTAERFVPDPVGEVPGERLYRTGDLTRNLPDGNVKFLGRLDFQVKVRGFRIELGEIETALRHVPGVREALVVARTEDGVRLVAYLVPSGPGEGAGVGLELGELRTFLLERLPEFMVPAHFVTLDALPLAPNGKVDRAALPVPDRSHTAAAGLVPPSGPAEEKVAEIWAEVLRLDRVGAHDNFFELGGHSLIATQVLARLEDAFGIDLPLRDLFEYPTVAGLAERIVQADLLRADAGLMERLLAGLED
ncbi:MAG TPA: non-ribosomal peptide synthetase, partial [Acidobacteria bacterium]|nr:non-ribosomal peptide synthetase [Acidobacteriota bacterium]